MGLRRAGDTLQIDPCVPRNWTEYEMRYRYGDTRYHIRVENPDGVAHGVREVTLDGEKLDEKRFPLVDDGNHHQVRVVMGDG